MTPNEALERTKKHYASEAKKLCDEIDRALSQNFSDMTDSVTVSLSKYYPSGAQLIAIKKYSDNGWNVDVKGNTWTLRVKA